MTQTNLLRLKNGAALIEQDNQVGASLGGKTRLARDALQGEALRRLCKKNQSAETLQAALCAGQNAPPGSPEIALALAGFILDFSDFLED